MAEHTLRKCRILIVEDEYMLADELRIELSDEGATIVGPTGTLDDAFELVRSEPRIDAAVLDVNLGGSAAYPLADELMERRVPFVFTTGYDDSVIPRRYAGVARCEKPFSITQLKRELGRVIHA